MANPVAIYLVCWLAGMAGLIPLTLALQTLLPRFLRQTSENLERAPWRSLIVGLLAGLTTIVLAGLTQHAGGGGKLLGVVQHEVVRRPMCRKRRHGRALFGAQSDRFSAVAAVLRSENELVPV